MRSNNTVALDSHALGTLNYIRASIDAAGAFAVPGTAGIAMGAVGLVAAGVASVPALGPHWLVIWLTAATVGAGVGVVLVARHRSGIGLPLYRGPARRFVLCLCPALLAGGVLTAVLCQAGEAQLLPGVWLLLYGCAVLSATLMTAPAMMRLIGAMGGLFVLCAAVAFEVSPRWHNVILGGGFGVLHVVFGFLIGRIEDVERSPT
ncbi:MAG TPA: hypothetical protein VGN43_11330 [Steroidobacteraceae bacterium]|jgi:hypothetical protein|nr:hypothetical protein [Steroidobacteraceae bacterium]